VARGSIIPAPTRECRTLQGRLVRRDGAFLLQGDMGVTFELLLPRVPVDHVGKTVIVTGREIAPGLFEVEGVRAG
jgi:hypothetical protein